MEVGFVFGILAGDTKGNLVGLVKVTEVYEKFSIAQPFWRSSHMPELKTGWHLFNVRVWNGGVSG